MTSRPVRVRFDTTLTSTALQRIEDERDVKALLAWNPPTIHEASGPTFKPTKHKNPVETVRRPF